MKVRWVVFLSLMGIVGLMSLSVQAQELEGVDLEEVENQEQPLDLGEVVVTATKTERAIEDVPASVTLIKKEDIEKTTARYVDDILRYEAGIDVDRAKGGLSSPSTHVRLRGFPHPRAVVVMRDGVPINRAVCGGAKWNETPVDIVEKVEIVRGASSSLYGSGAMSGIINIFTKAPGEKSKITLKDGFGTHNTWESSTTISGPLSEKFGYILNYNRLETNGYIPEIEQKSTSIDNYRNADNIFAKFVYDIDDSSSLSFSHSYWEDEISMGRIHNHKDFRRNRTIIGYKAKQENFDIAANIFYLDEEFVDYIDKKNYGNYGKLAQVRHRPGKDTGANLSISFPLTENQFFTTGIDYRWAKMKDDLENFKDNEQELVLGKQHRTSLFLEDEIDFGGVGPGTLLINLSCRGDWYKTYDGYHSKTGETDTNYSSKDGGAFNPKLGVVYHLSNLTTLRGSIGRAFHMPYLYSLYGTTECPPGKMNVGNPDLNSEYVVSYELGLDQKIGKNLVLRLTGFYNDINDWMEASYWKTAGGNKQYKWSNIDKTETAGIELEGEYKLFPDLFLFANYAYLYTEVEEYTNPPGASLGTPYTSDDYKGNQLTNQAQNKVNVGLTYDNPKILTTSLKCRYVGTRYDNLENTTKLKSYVTADFLLSRKIGDSLQVSFEINDLFDKSWQEDSGWLVSSGRTFMCRVKLAF